MNILREVGRELLKMFVADAWLAVGVVMVVALCALLTRSGTVPPLIGGAILFLGCIGVLLASVALASRQYRLRLKRDGAATKRGGNPAGA